MTTQKKNNCDEKRLDYYINHWILVHVIIIEPEYTFFGIIKNRDKIVLFIFIKKKHWEPSPRRRRARTIRATRSPGAWRWSHLRNRHMYRLSHNPWLGYVRLQVDLEQWTFERWCTCGNDDRSWEWVPAIYSTIWEKMFLNICFSQWDWNTKRVTAGRWIMGEWEKIWECERRMTVYDVVVWEEVSDQSSLFQRLKSKLRQTLSILKLVHA